MHSDIALVVWRAVNSAHPPYIYLPAPLSDRSFGATTPGRVDTARRSRPQLDGTISSKVLSSSKTVVGRSIWKPSPPHGKSSGRAEDRVTQTQETAVEPPRPAGMQTLRDTVTVRAPREPSSRNLAHRPTHTGQSPTVCSWETAPTYRIQTNDAARSWPRPFVCPIFSRPPRPLAADRLREPRHKHRG